MDVARILQLRTMVDDPDFVREVGKLVCAVVGALKERDLDLTPEVLDEMRPRLAEHIVDGDDCALDMAFLCLHDLADKGVSA